MNDVDVIKKYIRRRYKDGRLTDEQLRRLTAIGFDFASNLRVCADYESLMREWNWNRNRGIDPHKTSLDRVVWWKCADCGEEFQGRGRDRLKAKMHRGCVSRSLGKLYPEIANEWHPTKNGNLTPFDVRAKSNKRVWWQHVAADGSLHEWESSICNRTGGSGCPLCRCRHVTCWETGQVFLSAKDAAECADVSVESIRYACSNLGSTGGWHWYYSDTPCPDSKEFGPLWVIWDRPLMCIEDRHLDTTLDELADSSGLKISTLKEMIRHGKPINGRHYWPKRNAYPVDLIFSWPDEGAIPYGSGYTCIETGEHFTNAEEAACFINLKSGASIASAARNGMTAGGLHWVKGNSIPSGYKPADKKNHVSVICLETGKEFESMKDAAEHIGCSPSSISGCCADGGTVKGLHWYRKGASIPQKKKAHEKPVICVETGKVYKSAVEASRAFGITNRKNSNIGQAIKTGHMAYGYHWAHVVEGSNPTASDFAIPTRYRPVRCIETGDVFGSIKEASESFGIDRWKISNAINGKRETAGGYHWEKADASILPSLKG